MKQLRVTEIQRGCVYDGPGVRTTIFFKGCPLRCPWCCNPETQSFAEDYYVDNKKCLLYQGVDSKLCVDCVRKQGKTPVESCPFGVSEKTSVDYTPDELIKKTNKDKSLFISTGGGITLSGGEPLLQADALVPYLNALNNDSVNIAIETTLVSSFDKLTLLKPYLDLFIIDLKLQPQMCLNSPEYIDSIALRIDYIKDKPIQYRMVYVDDIQCVKDTVLSVLKRLSIRDIEILKCHNLASKKYQRMSRRFTNFVVNEKEARLFVDFLQDNNINSNLLTI